MSGEYRNIADPNDVSTLNEEEQDLRRTGLEGVLNTASNYEDLLRSLMSGRDDRESALYDAASNFDPQAASNQLLSLFPQLGNLASSIATQSTSSAGESARELAGTATQEALRNTASQLASGGLLNSGAANASLMEAALRPQQELATQLATLQSNAYNNALSGLTNQIGSGLTAGYSQQGSQNMDAATSSLSAFLQSMGLGSDMLAGQGNNYASLADLTAPVYYGPQYEREPGALDWMTSLLGLGTGAASLGLGPAAGTGLQALMRLLNRGNSSGFNFTPDTNQNAFV